MSKNNRRLHRVTHAFYGMPWAIMEPKLREVERAIDQQRSNPRALSAPSRAATLAARSGSIESHYTVGNNAVIPVMGIIGQRMNMLMEFSGGTSTEILGRQMEEAASDPSVKRIVLDVDSPGGSVFGTPELAAKMLEIRRKKPIIAVANSLMASAAYWIASQANEIVVTPGGQVGSIGVYVLHEDVSAAADKAGIKVTPIFAGKYKVDGHPYEALSDTARAGMQAEVDTYYTMFVNAVAKGRGTTPEAVRNGYGEGRALTAWEAVSNKLVDRVATLDQVLAETGTGGRDGGSRAGHFAAARQRQLEAELELDRDGIHSGGSF